MKAIKRREFVRGMAAGAVAGASFRMGSPAQTKAPTCPVVVFSKHLQWLSFEEMGEEAAGVGFDGIDLTVRPGGHVAPEDAARELPRAVAAVKAAGLQVPTVTTAINSADEASRRILGTAADQGVRFYRLGYFDYPEAQSLDESLDRARRSLDALARLNQELGICGDYQNHAGAGYLGASIWDLWYVLRELDPRWLGCQFDLRHATVEGARSWPVDFRRIADRVHTTVAKDFRWEGDEVVDCPLGEGITPFGKFLPMLRQTGFQGPVTLHLEYPLGGADSGRKTLSIPREQVRKAMVRDLSKLRSLLKTAQLG